MKKLMTIAVLVLFFGCNCDPCEPDEDVTEDVLEDSVEDAIEENEDDGVVEDSVEDVLDEDITEDSVDDVLEDAIEDPVDDSEEIVSTCMTDSECNEWCIDHEGRAGGGCFEFVDEEAGICTCPAARSECECYD